jgi:2-methylcitrate dehydratase PrpD
MGLMLDLIIQHDIKPAEVKKVAVGVNRQNVNALIHNRPTNELQAKFSMQFCMAILLLRRKAGLAEFTDEVVNRPDVKAMIEKIEYGVHPVAEAAGYEKMTTIIDIELADGRKISGSADFGKGSPANPMTDDELANKFRECAAWGKLPRADAEEIIDMVFALEKLKNIRELTRLLQTGARPTKAKNILNRKGREGRQGKSKTGQKSSVRRRSHVA